MLPPLPLLACHCIVVLQVVLQQAWTAHTADLRTQLEKLQVDSEQQVSGQWCLSIVATGYSHFPISGVSTQEGQ